MIHAVDEPTPYEQARAALLDALKQCRPLLETDSPPSSISFILPIDNITGRPRKAIWRMEGERDLTGRTRPAYRSS